MPKLLMLQGLPASGKSTYAKALVKGIITDFGKDHSLGWKRVNKDDLRSMIDNGSFSRDKEKIVKDIETNLVFRFLRDGYNVVVDDTNFVYEEIWKTVASTCGAEFEVMRFDIPVYEAIERDAKRGEKSVGTKVILEMYFQYIEKHKEYIPEKKGCYIFDIDGTLARMDGRSPYDYTKVGEDKLNIDVSRMIGLIISSTFGKDYDIIICSGREESCREETAKWLDHWRISRTALYMRETNDKRDDATIKREIYEKYIEPEYNVLGVFDDRNRVVDMWRSLGLTCFQVNYGNF